MVDGWTGKGTLGIQRRTGCGEQNYQINKDKEGKGGAGIRARLCTSATGDWDWSFRCKTRE